MSLVFTRHARKRMDERGVTAAEVETVLRRPTGQRPGDGGNIVVQGELALGRIIEVVVSGTDREFVISVWVREV